jgi:allantoinase
MTFPTQTTLASACELVIKSSRIITPEGSREGGIAIAGGMIQGVLERRAVPSGDQVLDVGDKMVLPGLIDTHVHVGQPGLTEWEGFKTATKAAAAGGVTTLIDMPRNCIPVTTNLAALERKIGEAKGRAWVDYGFWGAVVPDNQDALDALAEAGVFGYLAYLADSGMEDFPPVTVEDLDEAMPILADLGLPLLVHAEIEPSPPLSLGFAPPRSYASYLRSRPAAWEVEGVRLIIELCREHACRVHIVHLSAADALPLAQQARTLGLPLTVETCPHYLALTAEEIRDGRTEFKAAPPIREAQNKEQLWAGLESGVIDLIASDHAPCSPDRRLPGTGDFLKAWPGIASLQFGLSVVWTEARARGIPVERIMQWMSRTPARLLGLGHMKGAITPGYDADLVVWDPDASITLSPDRIYHRHRVTPYLNRTLYGEVLMTFLRGQKIYDKGNFLDWAPGKFLRRSVLSPGPVPTRLRG